MIYKAVTEKTIGWPAPEQRRHATSEFDDLKSLKDYVRNADGVTVAYKNGHMIAAKLPVGTYEPSRYYCSYWGSHQLSEWDNEPVKFDTSQKITFQMKARMGDWPENVMTFLMKMNHTVMRDMEYVKQIKGFKKAKIETVMLVPKVISSLLTNIYYEIDDQLGLFRKFVDHPINAFFGGLDYVIVDYHFTPDNGSALHLGSFIFPLCIKQIKDIPYNMVHEPNNGLFDSCYSVKRWTIGKDGSTKEL